MRRNQESSSCASRSPSSSPASVPIGSGLSTCLLNTSSEWRWLHLTARDATVLQHTYTADPMSAFDVDFFVIGGGSGGVRAARVAAEHGAKVAIAEESR